MSTFFNFDRLIGNNSTSSSKNKRRKFGRTCRIEELEGREMLSVSPFSMDYDVPYKNDSEQVQTQVSATVAAEKMAIAIAAPAPEVANAPVAGKVSGAKQSKEKALTTVTLTWNSTYPSDSKFLIINDTTKAEVGYADVTHRVSGTASGYSYTIEGLPAGNTYKYTITACDASENILTDKPAKITAKTLTEKQAAVKSVKLVKSSATLDSLKLQWKQSAATDVTGYVVKYIGNDGLAKAKELALSDLTIDSKGIAVMKEAITDLPAGTKVKFQVVAVTSTGIESTVVTSTASTAKAQLPTLKKVKAEAPNAMTVEWVAPSKTQVDGYTLVSDSYVLYYRETPGKNDPIEKWQWKPAAAGAMTSTTVSGLKNNTKYEFMVVSTYTKGANSIQVASKLKSAKTQKTGADIVAEPTNVTITATGNTINVEWNAVPGASGYVVEYSTSSSFKESQTTDPLTGTSATITDLDADKTYYVRVKATGSNSDYSVAKLVTTDSVITIAVPSDLAARQSANSNTINLMWTADMNAAKYVVERSTTGTDGWTTIGEATTGSYTDDDNSLADEVTYYYRVTVYSDATTSCGVSNVDSVLFVDVEDEDRITNLKVVQKPGGLEITWDLVPGAYFGYQVSIYDGSDEYTWLVPGTQLSLDTVEEKSDDDDWFVPVLGVEYEITVWELLSDTETTVKVTFGTQHTVDFEFLKGVDFLGPNNAFPYNLAWNGESAFVYPDWLTFEEAPQYGVNIMQYFVDSIGFTYNMSYDDFYDYYDWYGFGLSTATDTTTVGLANEMSSITGTGANGSLGYGIAYWAMDDYDWNTGAIQSLVMQLPDGAFIDSMMITNTFWAWNSLTDGDSFADPMEAGKYFTLIIVGLDADGNELTDLGTVEFDLGKDDYIVSDWEKLNLSSLAGASQLQFSFDADEKSKSYGWINYPIYFAFDDIVYYTV